MTTPAKPPVPAAMFLDWPRIPVDTSEDSPYTRIHRIANRAAGDWILGDEGPYKQEMALAHIVRGAVGEALVHLLELGLIDIDTARIKSAPGIPWARKDCRPDTEEPTNA
ncbi:hypothetical protein [Streptomyces europaeiscabiei]|uniref:hypothetical protein n=1 Tax=Streptomyces europaeiscabiei TaxID=146819 RepID=UPI0029B331A9|nr:hypothetical protein [Streptomyces europaeiscabiei]MDX3672764.1 hypothetical protein [Streptomyces europaeiscabiei]